MNKILVQFPYDDLHAKKLEEICDRKYEIHFVREQKPEEKEKLLSGTEIVIGNLSPDLLKKSDGIRWLQAESAGVDNLIPVCREKGIFLTAVSGAFGHTISEFVIALLTTVSRHLQGYARKNSGNYWEDLGSEWKIAGKNMLVLGTGDLGTATAVKAAALGMHVFGYKRNESEVRAPFEGFYTGENIDEGLKKADCIVGCLPETKETINFLNYDRLKKTKKNAILLNVGRGSLIDTGALVTLLKEGHFFGVGLDVTNPEPLPENHELFGFDRVLITPHVAGRGFAHLNETRDIIWDIALDNLKKYIGNEPLHNVIDLKAGY